ncbi:MAG: phosphoribosylformylglycinamidine synthase subunit PurS [Bacteroidales bacterium]|jgi:phosphoribosylformylglycinamidine synthase|nr:phosphoribosylformylglycinamidine synthase subunit PurS [Bacteroidales bacterium]MDD4385593.1 phosphoribosylformylglycinamidine synthase subunit PurS [Bacteroidales bacterium]MDY0198801.1 phosphoribosylformylglycinamidine synthase subunit PurS [Tenuifilaceae bacterium]
MKYIAEINVMPLKALLDPQGKAVGMVMQNNGFAEVDNVRIGKHITLEIEAPTKEVAMERVNEACSKVLSNPIMEGYEYRIVEA